MALAGVGAQLGGTTAGVATRIVGALGVELEDGGIDARCAGSKVGGRATGISWDDVEARVAGAGGGGSRSAEVGRNEAVVREAGVERRHSSERFEGFLGAKADAVDEEGGRETLRFEAVTTTRVGRGAALWCSAEQGKSVRPFSNIAFALPGFGCRWRWR